MISNFWRVFWILMLLIAIAGIITMIFYSVRAQQLNAQCHQSFKMIWGVKQDTSVQCFFQNLQKSGIDMAFQRDFCTLLVMVDNHEITIPQYEEYLLSEFLQLPTTQQQEFLEVLNSCQIPILTGMRISPPLNEKN